MYFVRNYANKYNNNKLEIDGEKFDSRKEYRFYLYLKDLEKDNIITDIKRQVKYELQPAFKVAGKTIRSINYIADFTCKVLDQEKLKNILGKPGEESIVNGSTIILDTKGYKTEVYKIKYKLMLYKGYKILEI